MSYPDNATASLAQFLFRDSQGAMYIIPRRAFHNGSQYGDAVTLVQDLSGNGNDLTGTAVFDRKPFAVTDQETLNNIRDAQIIRDVNMAAPVGNLGAGCTVVRVEPGWPVEFAELAINGNYPVTEDFSILIIIDRALTESEVRVIEEMGKKWGGGTFNPLVNYANGEQGVYLAPWDISTLWQDEERTVPVENYGDPVRVMDDLSPNGNHAVAPNSAARGTYGRMPAGVGIRNLLVNTEPTSGTGWPSVNAEITGAGDGWSRVTKTIGDDSAWSYQIAFRGDGEEIRTGYVRVRQGNTRYVWLTSKRSAAGNNSRSIIFDFENPGFTRNIIAGATPFFENLGDGSFLIGYSAPTSDGVVGAAECFGIGPCTHPAEQQTDVPIGAYVDFTRAQVNTGDEPLPYQRVGNQYDVSQAGVPDVYYIETDGIDDCYQTAPIDLTMYDSTSLAVGVQYLGQMVPGAAHIVELSENSVSNPGAYAVNRVGAVRQSIAASHSGTTRQFVTTGMIALDNQVHIHSLSGSISDPDLTVILMGELYQNTGSQGTGNLGDYSLNLFSRNASSSFFQGRFFGAIIVHPRSPYEEQNRQFLAMKAGVTL